MRFSYQQFRRILLSLCVLVSACTPHAVPLQRDEPSMVQDALTVPDHVTKSASPVSIPEAVSSDESVSDTWDPSLTEEQLHILRDAGTERPFTSPLLNEHRKGTYVSADCGEPVFRSEQKFESGTGWPSFWAPINPEAVVEVPDNSYGWDRIEIKSTCGGHLGHVFDDGPEPTGKRYCMNGLALTFIPDPDQ